MATLKKYNQLAGQRIQRIEALTDGVFAVALTLLVLDIRFPLAEIKGEKALINAFLGLTPKFLTYFLSFMTLGIFWVGHTVQFSYIEKSDRHLYWINLFFLMLVALLPFSTAFLSEHIEFKFAVVLYWFHILLLGIVVFLHWAYAYKNHFMGDNVVEIEVVNQAIRRRVIVAQALYALGAGLCVINNYLSIVFIILVQLNYALALFTYKSKEKKKL